mgnify:CR=1 FL=1
MSGTSTIVHLQPTTTMTPEQALHMALKDDLTDVLIGGYDEEGDFIVRSSRMSCADALWLAEKLKQYAINGGHL